MGWLGSGLKAIGKAALPALGGAPGIIALGAGSLYQGYKSQKKSDKLNRQALELALARDAELAPMRQMGRDQLMGAKRPDFNADFASSNPFARPLQRLG